jgi:tRNA (guanosine-2'-O-)-methyltransferase
VENQIEYLKQFVSDGRAATLERVLDQRTAYLTLLLENLYQPHNCSAILRTCDCLGVQHVHVVEHDNHFTDNTEVSMGASAWLSVHRHAGGERATPRAIEHLRASGYRVVAATPHAREVLVDDLDLHAGKIALLLGTEHTGLSREALDMADEHVKVPIHGFMESYNVSVCAALLVYSVIRRLRESSIDWRLPAGERREVLLAWYKHAVKSSDRLLERLDATRETAPPAPSTGALLDRIEKNSRPTT